MLLPSNSPNEDGQFTQQLGSTAEMANLEGKGNPNIKLLALDITDTKGVFASRE